jgi:hypothetical protein
MDLPASFSSLPPELVAKICTDPDLDKDDLVALRLTSKTQGVHASATKTFAKRYFTDVLLLWSEYSLETFVKICQHPVFGSSIHRIQLSCAHYDQDDFDQIVNGLRVKCHTPRYFLQQIQRLCERYDAEQYDRSQVTALLDQAFGLLAESNHSFVLAVSTMEEKSLGASKIWTTSSTRTDHFCAYSFGVLDCLLQAADKSGCRVRGVEIEVTCDLDMSLEDYSLDEWNEWESVRSLTELKLDLPTEVYDYRNDDGLLYEMLSLTPHLKTLHIRVDPSDRDNHPLGTLTDAIACLPLEELHLVDLYLLEESMTDMLEGLGSTLRRLKISDCAITGSWKQILLSIQQHALQLDELQISGTDREWMGDSVMYKGVIGVRSGVIELLQIREEMIQIGESELLSDNE